MLFSANLGMLWPDRPLLERIDAAARAGFGAIELHWPYDVPAHEVRTRCAGHGLDLLGINTTRGHHDAGEFGLAALPGCEAEFRNDFQACTDYARAAGARAIHIMAGVLAAEQRNAANKTLLANLAFACDLAPDLTLLLEPMNPTDRPDYYFSTAGEAAGVIAAVGAPNLRIMFDCYHIAMAGGDVAGDLARYLPLIGHIQIAAVPDRGEPDRGALDYAAIFAALQASCYSGWVGCEYRPRGDTDDGLGWMQSYL